MDKSKLAASITCWMDEYYPTAQWRTYHNHANGNTELYVDPQDGTELKVVISDNTENARRNWESREVAARADGYGLVTAFEWQGEQVYTHKDLFRALSKLESREDAQEFIRLLREHNPYADGNVGYAIGYFDAADRARLYDWFAVEHPLLDNAP